MNCERFEQQLADWIGGELSPEQREAMQLHARECPACQSAARGLQAAAAALESRVPNEDEAAECVASLALPKAVPARLRGPHGYAFLRYAAVIALAFGGGYFYRAGGPPAPNPPVEQTVVASGSNESGVAEQILMENAARIDKKFPGTPALSRNLLLLAQH